MAGTLKTDIATAVAALVAGDQAAMPTGYSVATQFEVLEKKRVEVERIAKEIQAYLPSGSAKTAMATIITDLT